MANAEQVRAIVRTVLTPPPRTPAQRGTVVRGKPLLRQQPRGR